MIRPGGIDQLHTDLQRPMFILMMARPLISDPRPQVRNGAVKRAYKAREQIHHIVMEYAAHAKED